MTAPTAVHDRVWHLSLPDWRTALKRRVKRPKRPSRLTVVWACYCLIAGGAAILNVLDHDWLLAACEIAYLAGGWPCMLGRRRWMDMRLWLLGTAFYFAGIFA